MAEIGVPDFLKPHLLRFEQDPRPVVLMTCGIAGECTLSKLAEICPMDPIRTAQHAHGSPGSGKSTLAKAVVAAFPSFTRVSIDQIIFSRHGLYGVDYPPEKYDEYQTEADGVYEALFRQLLREGKDIMLDRSFYAKEDRDDFKAQIEQAGGRWVLVYFRADKEVLWKRICERRSCGINADSALEITEELLDAYVEGFDVPDGEGELVIDVR